jgi:hypothetical protein
MKKKSNNAKGKVGCQQGKVDKKNSMCKIQLKMEYFFIWTQKSSFKIF